MTETHPISISVVTILIGKMNGETKRDGAQTAFGLLSARLCLKDGIES